MNPCTYESTSGSLTADGVCGGTEEPPANRVNLAITCDYQVAHGFSFLELHYLNDAMSVVRSARASRKGKIPGNFMLKWQSSGTKPLVRRPMTACQSCRTAKVKCDGQRECDNCTNRGIVCIYIHTSATVSPPAAPHTSAGESSTALGMSDATTTMPMDTTAYEHAFDGMANGTNATGSQHLTDFDWGVNPNSDVSLDGLLGWLYETDFCV